MIALGIDIGSSGVRAGLYDTVSLVPVAPPASDPFPDSTVTPARVRAALQKVLAGLGDLARVQVVSHSAFSPSLCVLGDDPALEDYPVLGHADRRSLAQARRIEATVGAEEFLHTVGNRPVPGGISVTSLCWLMDQEPALMKRVRTVGHLSTWLVRELTGQTGMDYSQACFTGLLDIVSRNWSRPIVAALKINPAWLPRVGDAAAVAGRVTADAARRYGLPRGTGVLSGIIDTSGAILCSDLSAGTLVHSLGTTDVLAMVVERPVPDPNWLTRHLGTKDKWLAVVTLAAGGSMLDWLHRALFADLDQAAFHTLARMAFRAADASRPGGSTDRSTTLPQTGETHRQADACRSIGGEVRFEPHLAGSRLSVEQPTAAFTGLSLATTRQDMLAAALAAYQAQTADSLGRLRRLQKPTGQVLVTGGASPLADLLHADWPGEFRYTTLPDANLRGLAALAAYSTGL